MDNILNKLKELLNKLKNFTSTTKGQLIVLIPILLLLIFFISSNKKKNKTKSEAEAMHLPKTQATIPKSIDEARRSLEKSEESGRIIPMTQVYYETFNKDDEKALSEVAPSKSNSLQDLNDNNTANEAAQAMLAQRLAVTASNPGTDMALQKLTMLLDGLIDRLDRQEQLLQDISNNRNSIYNPMPATDTSNEAGKNTGVHIVAKNKSIAGNEQNGATKGLEFIEAVIDKDLIVRQGDMIPIRIKKSFSHNGKVIAENTVFYAQASFQESRISLNTSGIVVKGSVLPLNVEIYDYDGFTGIYAPGTKESDIAKNDVAEAVKSIDATQGYTVTEAKKFAEQIATSAANTAIGLAKVLTARKISDQKIQVLAGYPLILKIKN